MARQAFSLQNISKSFVSGSGECVTAVDGVSFSAQEGGITCLLGPTGSGKTTILRILAGLENPDSGVHAVNGRNPAETIGTVGYLAQHHTLLPWMTIERNILLPLEIKRHDRAEASRRVNEIMKTLGIEDAGDFYPYEVSGGMMQRAALGRLLASDSRFWLLDEPFSSLDERTRHRLQRLLIELAGKERLSILFVTHSIDEAVYMADRIIILSAGPGHVVKTIDTALARPRNRLDSEYGVLMEDVRRHIESTLEDKL